MRFWPTTTFAVLPVFAVWWAGGGPHFCGETDCRRCECFAARLVSRQMNAGRLPNQVSTGATSNKGRSGPHGKRLASGVRRGEMLVKRPLVPREASADQVHDLCFEPISGS
jgi:hypothetical protein